MKDDSVRGNIRVDGGAKNKYYFQLLAKDYNGGTLGFYSGGVDTLYDSRAHGISLPRNIVESSFLTENLKSTRHADGWTSGGLMPYIFFRNVSASTYVYRPRGAFTGKEDLIDPADPINILKVGVERYRFNLTESLQLKNILGLGKTVTEKGTMADNSFAPLDQSPNYNPSAYPNNISPESGIVNLYADDIRYNIEIPSLPIKTFSTTALSNNVSGNERPVLYTTETFIEGAVTRLDNSKLVKNILPNNTKFIALKNRDAIKLNSLEVQVRRADDNEIATEITDVSVELLIAN